MALTFVELDVIRQLADDLKRRSTEPRPVDAIALGYPDLVCSREHLAAIAGEEVAASVGFRPSETWEQAAATHGQEFLRSGVLDTHDVFAAFGCKLTVVDGIAWEGVEELVDLNEPLDARYAGRFDLVIDPGTLEHVFNIGEAMKSVVTMIRTGGLVYHQAPLNVPNHGFYNFSPTFYPDFYNANGCSVQLLAHFTGRPRLEDVRLEHSNPLTVDNYPFNTVNAVVARKDEARERLVWPVQGVYANLAKRRLTDAKP